MDLNTSDLYWLVGLLEGEGCFTTQHNRPRIVVKMTDEDVIARVAELVDRPYRRAMPPSRIAAGGQVQYAVEFTGKHARAWMEYLRPYMGQRRSARIEEILRTC